jgi:hypothetical protein
MRERKKSSVVGQANITEKLPENSPYWKSNREIWPSAITPECQCHAGSGHSSWSTNAPIGSEEAEGWNLVNRFVPMAA